MENEKIYLQDVPFTGLMARRIFQVLIVANPYDAFMLEDDGRIDEKLFSEYTRLGLRFPPTFTQVSTLDEAQRVLNAVNIDLIICMPGTADNDAFDVAHAVKQLTPDVPCVVLTPFSHGITQRMQNLDISIFEYVFCWLGNTDLILSIIKLIEDKMNMEHDILEGGVQMLLFVEDGIRFYSAILPHLYKYVLTQSLNFATEALNSQAEALRMRGRPKVVLARNYEEARELYFKYKDNVQGVISDCRFPINDAPLKKHSSEFGEKEATAGRRLLMEIREDNEYVPLIMQSSEDINAEWAHEHGVKFVSKNSKTMNQDIRQILEEHFGYGDFIFRDATTHEPICRVHNLKELQDRIFDIPQDSLQRHFSRNHMSRWLAARAIFPVSQFLKHITWHKLQDVEQHRQIIFDAIVQYRRMKNLGVVAEFDRTRFDSYSHFARIGDGSLGGKGRGLAFLDNIIKRTADFHQYQEATVQIPKTVVLCTDIFDEFMESNHLYDIALSDASDDFILQHFLRAHLPERLIDDFLTFVEATKCPLAIRSSSLLEDSHYQPFAGVYSTYMIPFVKDKYEMLRLLSDAIKGVYASVFFRDSKAYMTATQNVIDQEKMAVILQEVVGEQYGQYYYPAMSGVLRSLNYYPIGDEQAEEGIASLALGLGKYIVDGGRTLRVSPYHPEQVLQMSEMDIALKETQTVFYAIDTTQPTPDFKVDDGFNIVRRRVKEAANEGSLQYIASTFDPYDQIIRDGIYDGGRKVISFCGVLKNGVWPLPEIMQLAMKHGSEAMRRPVEIEFACNMHPDRTGEFYLLQIRPIVDSKQVLDEDLAAIPDAECLLRTDHSLGHGIIDDVTDVIYVKTTDYMASNNPAIADEIEQLNRKMQQDGLGYVLIGPGRWGSSDPWLGVPVKWPHICNARLIVEQGLENYHVDPSQGTHFFQNLTSLGVGYFTIAPHRGDGLLKTDILDNLPAINETTHLRHVRFSTPLVIKMDGMKQTGVVQM